MELGVFSVYPKVRLKSAPGLHGDSTLFNHQVVATGALRDSPRY
jgi:hypothetical protein